MDGGVKFIFKTLVKIPWIITVFYLVFNAIAFVWIYSKALGFSYIVAQTVQENNYLTEDMAKELYDQADKIKNNAAFIKELKIVTGKKKDKDDNTIYTCIYKNGSNYYGEGLVGTDNKKQFGSTITCGVKCTYKFVWPLFNVEDNGNSAPGWWDAQAGGDINQTLDVDNTETSEDKAVRNIGVFDIVILNDVVGLKYYPDLASE